MKKIEKIKIDPKHKKALVLGIIAFFIIFLLLVIRIGWIQFVDGAKYKEAALKNQLTSRTIASDRGAIYDSTGKILAISSDVDTVSIDPNKIEYSDGTQINKEILAHALSDIFELNYEETLTKVNEASSSIIIAEKVTKDKITKLENWMEENDISSGIDIEEDLKRYYPYNNLASNLIGFTGTDGHGLMGLESSFDDVLSGVSGKILTLTDSNNGEIPNQEKTYIEAENGYDVYLTIDVNIQSIAEKYLSQAVEDNDADGGNVIIMEPSTGNILAMSTYPDYNLNSPFTPTNASLLDGFDNLSSEEKSDLLYSMWNNKAVQSTYEPGSTFKLITASAALEEGIIDTDNETDFLCTGSETVSGVKINCWRSYDPHGYQSLREALANSCNPAFIQLGQKVGAATLYKYYSAFGLFDKTGSSLYGESNSIFHNLSNVGDVELATMSFGQRFTITPLQLITAVSAITNEGILMKPNIIKEIRNVDTGVTTYINPTQVRQVISKETAEKMMGMLEYVVTNGTGKYAAVEGYSVGGKSGTSEPLYGNSDSGYVASFIGMSPTVNTQVVALVILYNPKGDSHQGGQVCGPVVSQILGEVLPYLGVPTTSSTTSSSNSSLSTTLLPDVRNQTISEAKSILKSAGFNVEISGNEDESTTLVIDQNPKPGVSLLDDSTVYLYTENNNTRTSTTVPNFKGMSAEQAINSANSKNLNLIINGSGIVISQDIASEKEIEIGSTITLTLQEELSGGY